MCSYSLGSCSGGISRITKENSKRRTQEVRKDWRKLGTHYSYIIKVMKENNMAEKRRYEQLRMLQITTLR